MRLLSATALSSVFPEPIRIAMSSAVLSEDFPLLSSFPGVGRLHAIV